MSVGRGPVASDDAPHRAERTLLAALAVAVRELVIDADSDPLTLGVSRCPLRRIPHQCVVLGNDPDADDPEAPLPEGSDAVLSHVSVAHAVLERAHVLETATVVVTALEQLLMLGEIARGNAALELLLGQEVVMHSVHLTRSRLPGRTGTDPLDTRKELGELSREGRLPACGRADEDQQRILVPPPPALFERLLHHSLYWSVHGASDLLWVGGKGTK